MFYYDSPSVLLVSCSSTAIFTDLVVLSADLSWSWILSSPEKSN
jgi:hypothetical protein